MFLPTSSIVEVKDYPYGRLRTSMFFSLEFKDGKGFRAVRQSINPKTGKLNKPKKSTYSQIILLDNTDNFCTYTHKEFYKIEEFNSLCEFLNDNFDLFTNDQILYIYRSMYNFLRITIQSMHTYCNSSIEELLLIIKPVMTIILAGLKTGDNIFDLINLDYEAVENTKEVGYQPFKVVNYGI